MFIKAELCVLVYPSTVKVSVEQRVLYFVKLNFQLQRKEWLKLRENITILFSTMDSLS